MSHPEFLANNGLKHLLTHDFNRGKAEKGYLVNGFNRFGKSSNYCPLGVKPLKRFECQGFTAVPTIEIVG